MKITELRTNHVLNPLGYAYNPLSFSWKAKAEGSEKEQKYARIQIEKDGKYIYDSGESADVDSMDFPVNLELKPRCRYDWTVTVTAVNGETAQESKKNLFEWKEMKGEV